MLCPLSLSIALNCTWPVPSIQKVVENGLLAFGWKFRSEKLLNSINALQLQIHLSISVSVNSIADVSSLCRRRTLIHYKVQGFIRSFFSIKLQCTWLDLHIVWMQFSSSWQESLIVIRIFHFFQQIKIQCLPYIVVLHYSTFIIIK